MTAKTGDGNEIYSEAKTYMPIPQQLGRGTAMGRGPYDKGGLIEETGLPVDRTVTERFDIPVPGDEAEAAAAAKAARGNVEVGVRLYYLPFGDMDASPFLWREVVKTVTFGVDD